MTLQLFSDGGLVGANPSPVAGTWAWCLVGDGKLIACDWGLIYPDDLGLPAVTNNVSELYAAVRGLEANPTVGEWLTDSQVTLRRLTKGGKFKGVPAWLVDRSAKVRKRRVENRWKATLLAGHPTRAELASGFARRNRHPVSVWNVLCDQLCGRAAKSIKDRTDD